MKNGLDLSDQIGSSKPGKRGLKVKEELKQEVKEEVDSDRSELQTRKTRHKVYFTWLLAIDTLFYKKVSYFSSSRDFQ